MVRRLRIWPPAGRDGKRDGGRAGGREEGKEGEGSRVRVNEEDRENGYKSILLVARYMEEGERRLRM